MGRRRKPSRQQPGRSAESAQILQSAIQLHQQGRLDDADGLYRQILASDPGNADALNLSGLAAFQSGRIDDSLSKLQQATRLSPKTAKFHFDFGVVLQHCERNAEATKAYRQALVIDPEHQHASENLGVSLFDSNDNQGAIVAFEQVLEKNPDSLLALANLATLYRWQGRHDSARELLEHAIDIDPLNADLHNRHAELLLSLGLFEPGWPEYQWRFLTAGLGGGDEVEFVPLPKWNGNSLSGRTVLVHGEQGIGDEVMFASCLPDVLTTGAKVRLLCDPRLTPIFARSFPDIEVIPNKFSDWAAAAETETADWRIPCGNLPGFFRRTTDSFKPHDGYLLADPAMRKNWRERLTASGTRLNIGISWRGGANPRTREARTIDLAEWQDLFKQSDVSLINLQYGECREEIASAPAEIRDRLITFSELDPLTELDNFMALVAELDLIIAVDNSTVHFAGALNVPVWAIIPALSDWRWPVEGEDSRWYPSVKLVRREVDATSGLATIQSLSKRLRQFEPSVRRHIEAAPEPARKAPPSVDKQRRALLINDTSFWYHWGCTCTSLALRSRLQGAGYAVRGVPPVLLSMPPGIISNVTHLDADALFERFTETQAALYGAIQNADRIIINGEGSLHGRSPLSTMLLWLANLACTRLDKPVHIINHSCYPDDRAGRSRSPNEKLYQHVYKNIEHVAVRETVSAALLTDLGLEVAQSFDCLPLFVEKHRGDITADRQKRIIIAGSAGGSTAMLDAMCALIKNATDQGLQPCLLSGANAFLATDDREFARALRLRLGKPIEFINAHSALEWLNVIASGTLLVSGRFHHSIAAACLGTPFIALDSNTPKMDGLMAMLELETRLNSKDAELTAKLLVMAKNLLAEPEQARITAPVQEKLLTLAGKNFSAL